MALKIGKFYITRNNPRELLNLNRKLTDKNYNSQQRSLNLLFITTPSFNINFSIKKAYQEDEDNKIPLEDLCLKNCTYNPILVALSILQGEEVKDNV